MTERFVALVSDPQQSEIWESEIEEMGASKSEWVKMMVEAGRKKFDREVEPDETRAELREQRNRFRDDLHDARDRINTLERQLSASERPEVIEFVAENPGVTSGDISQHLVTTMAERVPPLLAELEGAELRVDGQGRFYADND